MVVRRIILLVVVVAIIGIGAFYYFQDSGSEGQVVYRFGKVTQGPMEVLVSSTGKVHPVLIVDVGSQVSGQVSEVFVDYNALVKEGEIIARIDPAPFEARFEIAEADLAQAEASVVMQKASLEQLKADIVGAMAALKELEQDLERQQLLLKRNAVSESIVDRAVASRDQASARVDSLTAQLKKQRAQIGSVEAQVQSRAARLRESQTELDNTIIRSPVDGVVINRDIDPGQTVAASLQAPVLFSIAQDLREIHLEVSVDEADIGRVREGQQVRFTVDAYPDRRYNGEVLQIRKQPVEVSNVVTYVIIVSTRNDDDSLLPGMTANVELIIGERTNAIKVPGSALRFTPDGMGNANRSGQGGFSGGQGQGAGQQGGGGTRGMIEQLNERLSLTEEQQRTAQSIFMEMGQSIRSLREGGMEVDQMGPAIAQIRQQMTEKLNALLDPEQQRLYRQMMEEADAARGTRGRVWQIGPDGKPSPVSVMIGISDSVNTEILRGEIQPGDEVIIGRSIASR